MKSLDRLKRMIILKSIFYEDRELQNFMKEFYFIKKSLIFSLESILRNKIV